MFASTEGFIKLSHFSVEKWNEYLSFFTKTQYLKGNDIPFSDILEVG